MFPLERNAINNTLTIENISSFVLSVAGGTLHVQQQLAHTNLHIVAFWAQYKPDRNLMT